MQLSNEEKRLLTKGNPQFPEAYRLYLLGRYQLNKSTDDGTRKALENFRQAIDSTRTTLWLTSGWRTLTSLQANFNALPPTETFPKRGSSA